MKRVLAAVGIVLALFVIFWNTRGPRVGTDEAARIRKFSQDMERVVLVGHSTRQNKEGVFGPERYYIDSVTHVSGDTWLFKTRLEYRGTDVPVPIPLRVQWAGDTPVITLTDLAIPGVGTYTARVVLYRTQYAGTWSGEKGGGQLFGKIERQTADGADSSAPPRKN
jgi:hypothetical protein